MVRFYSGQKFLKTVTQPFIFIKCNIPIEKINSPLYVGQIFGMVVNRRACQSYNIFLGVKPSIGWLQGTLPDRYIKNVVMVGYNYRLAHAFYYFLGMRKAYYMLGVVDWEKNDCLLYTSDAADE